MRNVIVPLNAFSRREVLEKGQEAFIPKIFKAGAYGVEIRRELFPTHPLSLSSLKETLSKNSLFTVYSAPVELWRLDGSMNQKVLQQIFAEAGEIGASWIKVSLGHFNKENSDIQTLKSFLLGEEDIHLLVENDQTKHGGSIQHLKAFFEQIQGHELSIKMTFDIGNWAYSGENVQEAIDALKEYVIYLHLKHVELLENKLVTLPLPTVESAPWRDVVEQFPQGLVKALEFPIQPADHLQSFIELVARQREKAGK